MTTDTTNLVAQGYNAVYESLPNSPTLRRIWRDHVLGDEFPQGFDHISLLTMGELRRLTAELRLKPGAALADLACGAGGPSLWVARETSAQLIGIDISPVGISSARERARQLGLDGHSSFGVGSFEKTGLPAESFDAAMSADALQYAPDKRAAFKEVARILRPGGRLAFVAFELDPVRTRDFPVLSIDPVADYAPLIREAGLKVVVYEETAGWLERLTVAYQAVRSAEKALTEEMGEAAAHAMVGEVSLTLDLRPYRGRVLMVAAKGLGQRIRSKWRKG